MAEKVGAGKTAPQGPLAGLRVLDLTRLLPGPVATLHLADLGAEVIKIEDTGVGDYARTLGPDAAKANAAGQDSLLFRLVNRNKKSLRLDLKQAAGVEVLLRLAASADMLFESFRPGVADRLGIGYEAVRAVNPRLVYCAITGYGQTGPWAQHAGHDLNYMAVSGVLEQIGTAGGAPAIPNLQIGDLLGGSLTALVGALAAVIGAKATGQGSYVDIAMTDAVLAHNFFPLLTMQAEGRPRPRGEDLLTGGVPCYGVYRTADARYLAVAALEPKFWQGVCDVLDRPDLVAFGLATGREGERVRGELAALIASHPLAFWQEKFATVDCCVTPVLGLDETVVHPQIMARQMAVENDGITQWSPPFKFSHWPLGSMRPAPEAGADSEAILKAAGYVDDEIVALRCSRVI
jgi:crotonobetainyl-CoA:carnitine CoA-transferase CaiB-like acyl-CoA transferase